MVFLSTPNFKFTLFALINPVEEEKEISNSSDYNEDSLNVKNEEFADFKTEDLSDEEFIDDHEDDIQGHSIQTCVFQMKLN